MTTPKTSGAETGATKSAKKSGAKSSGAKSSGAKSSGRKAGRRQDRADPAGRQRQPPSSFAARDADRVAAEPYRPRLRADRYTVGPRHDRQGPAHRPRGGREVISPSWPGVSRPSRSRGDFPHHRGGPPKPRR